MTSAVLHVVTVLLVVASSLAIAAHFLRMGAWWLSVVCLLAPVLLLFRRRWAVVTLQAFLVLASLEWVRFIFVLIPQYEESGRPYLRMVLILLGVAAAAQVAVFLLQLEPLRRFYHRRKVTEVQED